MPRSKNNEFFNGETPHGHVKRFMLKYFLQAFLPSTLRQGPPIQVTIIDGFAGAGRYSLNWPESIEKYGSPIIALRVAIEEVANRKKLPLSFHVDLQPANNDESTREKLHSIESFKAKRLKSSKYYRPLTNKQVTLVFVECNTNNYKELVKNVFQTFVRYEIKTNVDVTSTTHVFIESVEEAFQIECIFVCAKFEQILPPKTYGQLFTFIDPFGYSHTPLKAVRRFIGPNKHVYINFMSSYVNRFARHNPSKVADLFGIEQPDETNCKAIDEFVKSIRQYKEGEVPTNNIVNLMETYKQNIRKTGIKYQLSFEMRGKSNNIIYHLLYISNAIYYVRQMKESFNRGAQEPSALKLSDYYIVTKGLHLNLKNIQRDEDVAHVISEKFAGLRVSIDEIDTYVTVETPYVFRKTPLSILQKRKTIVGAINHEGKGQQKRFTFPDKDKNNIRNNWKITFGLQE